MVVGKYLRANIKYWILQILGIGRTGTWGVEGERLFAFPRSVCLGSSLVQDVAKKPCALRFFEMKTEPWSAAEAAG